MANKSLVTQIGKEAICYHKQTKVEFFHKYRPSVWSIVCGLESQYLHRLSLEETIWCINVFNSNTYPDLCINVRKVVDLMLIILLFQIRMH